MIHHLIFTDTFFVDLVMPFYLLIDGLLSLGFYMPYTKEIHYTSDLLIKIYGYAFSTIFIAKLLSKLDWKSSKQSLVNNLTLIIFCLCIVEIFLFYICGAIALTEILSTFFGVKSFLLMLIIQISSLVLLAPVIAIAGVGAYLGFGKVATQFFKH